MIVVISGGPSSSRSESSSNFTTPPHTPKSEEEPLAPIGWDKADDSAISALNRMMLDERMTSGSQLNNGNINQGPVRQNQGSQPPFLDDFFKTSFSSGNPPQGGGGHGVNNASWNSK